MTDALSLAADWIGTFALHSTCALTVALLASRLLGRRAVGLQETLLRTSMWLALPSATLQVFVIGNPWSAGFSLPRAVPSAVPVAEAMGAIVSPADVVLAPVAAAMPAAELPWATIVTGSAAALAFAGLSWLWSVHRRLSSVLAHRQPELDARVLRTAAEVAREAGLHQTPHLSRCLRLATPIAFGWLRPEICLPARASELADAPLRAMIAHEIAHLRRGDPASMWLAASLQAIFPWQLLFLAVRRRWARLVELRCDAIAATHSSSTAVARCLLDVAEWLRPDARRPGMALAMAARPSSLRERVEAALNPRAIGAPRRLVSLTTGAMSLAALAVGGPGVQSVATPEAPVESSPDIDVSLADAVRMLEIERRELVREAERLQRDHASLPSSQELDSMHALLRARLIQLERTSARLQARLVRSPSEAR